MEKKAKKDEKRRLKLEASRSAAASPAVDDPAPADPVEPA